MAGKEEHRECTRVLIRIWVEVRAGNCVIKTHEPHDLSMTGISLSNEIGMVGLEKLDDFCYLT